MLSERTPSDSGMSLAEMLVTLVILSLVLTLSVQSGVKMSANWQARSIEQQILQSVEQARREALAVRQRQILRTENIILPHEAANWRVELPDAIVFSKSGMCTAGILLITPPGQPEKRYSIAPPECTPTRQPR